MSWLRPSIHVFDRASACSPCEAARRAIDAAVGELTPPSPVVAWGLPLAATAVVGGGLYWWLFHTDTDISYEGKLKKRDLEGAVGAMKADLVLGHVVPGYYFDKFPTYGQYVEDDLWKDGYRLVREPGGFRAERR